MANPNQTRRIGTPPAITPALNPFFGLLPQALWNNAKDFFVYGDNYLPVAAGATVTQSISVESDSDFLIVTMNMIVTQTDNTTFPANRPFLVSVFDQGSGRQLMNTPIHTDNLFGTAFLPGFTTFPKLIPRASTISTTLQNLNLATAYNVRIAYIGFKIFGGM